jgi:hypothetical protein
MNHTITIEKARLILGDVALSMTDEEVSELVTLFESMADQTINDFQTKIFGKPLNQLLTNYKNHVYDK